MKYAISQIIRFKSFFFIFFVYTLVGCGLFEELPITPLLDTKEIAELTSEERSVVVSFIGSLCSPDKNPLYYPRELSEKGLTLYIQVFGKNPDQEILDHFKDSIVLIKPAHMGLLRGEIIYDPEANWEDLISVSKIEIDGEKAKVTWSYFHASEAAAGFEWDFIRNGEFWEITKKKRTWIS